MSRTDPSITPVGSDGYGADAPLPILQPLHSEELPLKLPDESGIEEMGIETGVIPFQIAL